MIKQAINYLDVKSFWGKSLVFSVVLFFVSLGDAILSDWVPAYMQGVLGSSLVMGMVMSFSSVIGFGADLIFPQLLKGVRIWRLVLLGIGTSLVFTGVMWWSVYWPVVMVFLLGMAVWGVYYEFLGFGGQQFVADVVPTSSRASVWAVIGVFKSLAYFLGPVLGSMVTLGWGNRATVLLAAVVVMVGYLVYRLGGKIVRDDGVSQPAEKVNLINEIGHWRVLFGRVWPVLTISLVLGLIDATFWTTGTVLSDSLATGSWLGGMFLPFYTLPMIFVGLVVAKWGIFRGKKKMAECFMLMAGVFLGLMAVSQVWWFLLIASMLSGIALSFAWPLTEAVYSDVIDRMGKEGKHMMGLSSSTVSLAYILGPMIAGGIAQMVGERLTFAVVGVATMTVASVLLVVTPKKLRLPQEEMRQWE